MRLKNKVIVVTGAGSGIGAFGAQLFAREGASVVVVDLNGDKAQEVAKNITDSGGSAVSVKADVTSVEDNDRIVDIAMSTYGRINGYWANAGITTAIKPLEEQDPDMFDLIFKVNAKGPWLGARSAMKVMKESPGSSFVVTSSLSGFRARPGNSSYSTSKGAAIMLTRSLAVEYAPEVRVNSLSPVSAETPMLPQFMAEGVDVEAAIQAMRDGVPLKRLAFPEDVCNAALFLLSDESSLISGVNLPIDGGISARN